MSTEGSNLSHDLRFSTMLFTVYDPVAKCMVLCLSCMAIDLVYYMPMFGQLSTLASPTPKNPVYFVQYSKICLFVFVALHPKSTALVIAGQSVHLTTLFSWASLNKQLTSNRAHTFACN